MTNIPMNSAHLFPDANENPKLERAGAAAAWYWACCLMFCRRREDRRRAAGERIDFIPEANAGSLFADTKARSYIVKLVEEQLWHRVDGGYVVNDYEATYNGVTSQLVIGHQPAGAHVVNGDQPAGENHLHPAGVEPPAPKPSQLGGMARAITSRQPAGWFGRRQPAGEHVSPTPPSDPEEAQKSENERSESESAVNKGSAGAGAGGDGKRSRRAPTVPMPDDFALTEQHLAHAAEKQWPEWWVQNRFERFCDLARLKQWRYTNWTLALYVFLKGEIGYRQGPADLAHLAPGGSTQLPSGTFRRGPTQNNHGKTGTEKARRL